MMNREPYQIVIMRPTGGKAIMTVRSCWVRMLVILACLLVAAVIVCSIGWHVSRARHADTRAINVGQRQEIKDLNIYLARKDQEIITLKQKMSTAIHHQASIIPATIKLPKLHTPTVELGEVTFGSQGLDLKIINLNPGATTDGYFFAIFRHDKVLISHPAVTLTDGVPVDKKAGLAFSIRNFKPMHIAPEQMVSGWDQVTFYVFDTEGRLRLAMPMDRSQLEKQP